jgi:hypothetical protein
MFMIFSLCVLSFFLFSKLFSEPQNPLGLTTTQAKIDAYTAGVSDKVLISLNLIGDPATRPAFNRDNSDLEVIHMVTAGDDSGGEISPAGEILAFDDENKTFTITPANGYTILDVTVDGNSQGEITTYTFNNISKDHTIIAYFESIDDSGGGGGGGGGGCFVSSVWQ